MNKKVGFIGCGKMASAIIGGVLSSEFLKNEDIMASERNETYTRRNKSKKTKS